MLTSHESQFRRTASAWQNDVAVRRWPSAADCDNLKAIFLARPFIAILIETTLRSGWSTAEAIDTSLAPGRILPKECRLPKDISSMLSGWDFDPDRVSVRIVTGDDGRDKLQLRLDLGMLQMEFDGRPDGAK